MKNTLFSSQSRDFKSTCSSTPSQAQVSPISQHGNLEAFDAISERMKKTTDRQGNRWVIKSSLEMIEEALIRAW